MSVRGKTIAFLTSAEVDALQGRTTTSWPTLPTGLRDAGATWVDQEVVVDSSGPGPLIASRKPDDVRAVSRELLAVLD